MPTTKKVDAIIQARLTSSRFPNKVNAMLGNKTVLSRVIENLQACENIDQIILAIPDTPENMDLMEYEHLYNIKMFAGAENDVLDRFIQAADFYGVKDILRICADAPFLPPWMVDYSIKEWNVLSEDYLFVGGFPFGHNVEIVKTELLKEIHPLCDSKEKEHVTFYLELHPKKFKTKEIIIKSLEVNTLEDLERIQKYV